MTGSSGPAAARGGRKSTQSRARRVEARPRGREQRKADGTQSKRALGRASEEPTRAKGSRLRVYRTKRDFAKTAEPHGVRGKRHSAASSPQFVVQKHAARSLHYDFRLEIDGVLVSWSVPKGPSLDVGAKRLAVRTEDHPLEYADFEGTIPQGEYGGGTVLVWDRGAFRVEGDPRQGLEQGKLNFVLSGEKLRGSFHLVRTRIGRTVEARPRAREQKKAENWLLIKGTDAATKGSPAESDVVEARSRAREQIVEQRPESVLSGRNLEDVASAPGRVWHSGSTPAGKAPKAGARAKNGDVLSRVEQLQLGIRFTNLDKLLYPEQGLRKADLIAYYASVASAMLPHVRQRPLTLLRCPHGSGTKCFFQKHANEGVPSQVRRVKLRENSGKQAEYLFVDDAAGLVALAQLGVLEVHTWGCHVEQLEQPDQLVIDLDPAEDLGFQGAVEAAREVRQRLSELGLACFLKTTGGKGLHVVVPLEPRVSWDVHREFAQALAEAMARDSPGRYVTNMRKDLRSGKVFLDYLRNGRGATSVAPYSTRASSGASVATPIHFEELDAGLDPQRFGWSEVLRRFDQADPWADYFRVKQTLSQPRLRKLGLVEARSRARERRTARA